MSDPAIPDPAARLARLALKFEDAAARIRAGAEGTGLSISEVRLLDGITGGESGARNLSRRMALDEGHVSRMVKRLRGAGLVTAERRKADARRVDLHLTDAGRARLDEAMAGARVAAASVLKAGFEAGFEPGDLPADSVETTVIELTGLRPGDAGWIIGQHGALYAAEEGFDPAFEAHVGYIVSNFVEVHDPERERAWIARRGDTRLGCIFCMQGKDSPHTAQLRLFLVRPEARRQGLGHRLLSACRDFAAGAGYEELVLYTHREHRAACALYEAFGFTRTDSYPVAAYGRDLEEQIWAIPLAAPLAKPARSR